MNTGTIIFLAVLAIIIAAPAIVIAVAVKKLNANRLIRTAAYTLSNGGFQQFDDRPRSLNGCESIYLSQIRSDFPDFDPTAVYTEAKRALEEKLSGKDSLKIHNTVISGYKKALYEKTVVLQAALQYREGGVLLQKRYVLLYSYLVGKNGTVLTANCPNCGAPVSDSSARICRYCDSLLVNSLGGEWKFTDISEG